MGEAERIATMLPASVVVTDQPDMRLTPNQMRALKAETGKTLEELMGEGADEADRLQAMVWLELRRQGYNASWDEIGDVGVEFKTTEPDPMSGEPSTSSPPSADSGA